MEEQQWLGNALPQSTETYRSCSSLCAEKFKDFEFYEWNPKVKECECLKLKGRKVPGQHIKLRQSAKLTFGYAQTCGKLT